MKNILQKTPRNLTPYTTVFLNYFVAKCNVKLYNHGDQRMPV